MNTLLSTEALACPDWMQFYLSGLMMGVIFAALLCTMGFVWFLKHEMTRED